MAVDEIGISYELICEKYKKLLLGDLSDQNPHDISVYI